MSDLDAITRYNQSSEVIECYAARIAELEAERDRLEDENRKLRAMIDEGLGWEDMRDDH